ncbi:hypothetical protein HAX54_003540 [Datura stramonium]|uniref:Uncharacterized protein n=1 Tax=Datura stramonium TaxID=4076 RepID=A0ABS8T677_DATST|nr:hypothetical protein [Datura stramonium]
MKNHHLKDQRHQRHTDESQEEYANHRSQQKPEHINSLLETRPRVTSTDLRTTDATRDPSSGLEPTTDWTSFPSAFHRTPQENRRMSLSQNKFKTFKWHPFTNTYTHFSELSTLHMKRGLHDDLPFRMVSPNLLSGIA